MGIDTDLLTSQDNIRGIELLSDLDKQKKILTGQGFGLGDRKFLARLPEYRRVWMWEEQLRIGYLYLCEIPDFDIEANNRLKSIIQELERN